MKIMLGKVSVKRAMLVAVGTMTLWAAVGLFDGAEAHGRMIEPPSRGSMWRFGFSTPPDYTDTQHNCGGLSRQNNDINKGRCGVCGDPYDTPTPRPHERGGKYGLGPIVRTYRAGATVDIVIDLTANHKGWFEFKICPTNNPSVEATPECLDKHVLPLVGSSSTKFMLATSDSKKYPMQVKLPVGLVCSHCVIQWKYRGGNNWGVDSQGQGLGHGVQEEFYGCADIRIEGDGGSVPPDTPKPPPTSWPTPKPTSWPTPKPTTTTTTTTTRAPPVGVGCRYRAVGPWRATPGMNNWCRNNCRHKPSYCPASHCVKVC